MIVDIRYGIIGTGMMGCEHIRNLAAMDNAMVVAIADPSAKSRQWALKACGERFKPTAYEHYHDLLSRPDLDAVVIASPNYTHIDVMRDVFATDLHVLLEKPICTTLPDALEVCRRAEQHRGLVWIALEYRYMAPTAALIRHLGEIGKIRMCAIQEHRFPFLRKVDNWNRFNRNTGGTLVEKCCHFFDLMNLVIQAEPIRVMASGGQSVNHLDEAYAGEVPDILDNAYVIVEYASGARAMLDLCMFAEGGRFEQQISITGDEGKLETGIPGDKLYLSRRADNNYSVIDVPADPRVREEGLHHGASYLEHLDFAAAIASGSPAGVTARDGLNAMLLGVAGHTSIETGLPVEPDALLKAAE